MQLALNGIRKLKEGHKSKKTRGERSGINTIYRY
jgi:hypothetical protein